MAYYDDMGRVIESHNFAFDQKAFDASIARSFVVSGSLVPGRHDDRHDEIDSQT